MENSPTPAEALRKKIDAFMASLIDDGVSGLLIKVICSHKHLFTDVETEKIEFPRHHLVDGELRSMIGPNGLITNKFHLQTFQGTDPIIYDIELWGT